MIVNGNQLISQEISRWDISVIKLVQVIQSIQLFQVKQVRLVHLWPDFRVILDVLEYSISLIILNKDSTEKKSFTPIKNFHLTLIICKSTKGQVIIFHHTLFFFVFIQIQNVLNGLVPLHGQSWPSNLDQMVLLVITILLPKSSFKFALHNCLFCQAHFNSVIIKSLSSWLSKCAVWWSSGPVLDHYEPSISAGVIVSVSVSLAKTKTVPNI